MKKYFSIACIFILVSFTVIMCGKAKIASTGDGLKEGKHMDIFAKPFRVLVVIGDQWTDPLSYAIDGRRVKSGDFLDVINMLKIWGVPFDILRLDQQRLQINRFLDGEAKPNYGCVIWMADPEKIDPLSANFDVLKRAVNEYGISMIALFDYIKNDQVAGLAGVSPGGIKNVMLRDGTEKYTITGDHFITNVAGKISLPDKNEIQFPSETDDVEKEKEDIASVDVVDCTLNEYSKVLAKIGDTPQMVVRDVDDDTKVVWIGGGKDWFRKYPVMRKIFRKALVYSIGYGLFNDDFENGFIFIMDDIGAADHSWFLRWHYPTPQKDTLLKYLIEPLEKHGLMMVQCITSGFANIEEKMITSPWTVKPFRDIYGNWQDYGSSKEGLAEGIRRGVFEIQHDRAWSHMNWDLESPPGPFLTSPIDGEKVNGDWYNEVSDVTRGNKPVPPNDMLFIYKTGIDAVKKSFGVTPLDAEVYPGSDLSENTHSGDDNGRIAAIAGLGCARDSYIGIDHTIEFRMMLPEQFTCHDLDLTMPTNGPSDPMGKWSEAWPKVTALTTAQLLKTRVAGVRSVNLHNQDWIKSRLDKHWMGYNEMCAYLHSQITSEKNGLSLFYDGHYCAFFEKKPSEWTLEVSDDLLKKAGKKAEIFIDGLSTKKALSLSQKLNVAAGLGTHSISFMNYEMN